MHELVRQYALQQFEANNPNALQPARAAHANYFLQLALTASEALNGPAQITLLNQLEDEHDNLRAALAWACDHATAMASVDAQYSSPLLTAAQLVDSLGQFWFIHGHHREGRRWLARVIGLIKNKVGESIDQVLIDQAYASALRWHGFLAFLQGDLTVARSNIESAIGLSRRNNDKRTQAAALHFLGLVASAQDGWDEARQLQEESAQLGDALGIPLIHALATAKLGTCAMAMQDWDATEARYREAAEIFRRINDHNQLAAPLRMLGYLALQRGNTSEARVYFVENLRLNLEVGDPRGQAACLMGLASAANIEGDSVLGVQLFGAANAVLKAVADSLMPGDQRILEPHIAALSEQLARPEIEQAYAQGRAMPAVAAIQPALDYGANTAG